MTDVQIADPIADLNGADSKPATRSSSTTTTVAERLLGLTAAFTLTYCCMRLTGAYPSDFLQVTAIGLVLAIITGGLIMSHGPRLIARMVAVSFGASAVDDNEVQALRSLCQRGRRLAYLGAVVQLATSTVHVLTVLDQPELIGPGLAAGMTVLVIAPVIAEVGFGSGEYWVARRNSN